MEIRSGKMERLIIFKEQRGENVITIHYTRFCIRVGSFPTQKYSKFLSNFILICGKFKLICGKFKQKGIQKAISHAFQRYGLRIDQRELFRCGWSLWSGVVMRQCVGLVYHSLMISEGKRRLRDTSQQSLCCWRNEVATARLIRKMGFAS